MTHSVVLQRHLLLVSSLLLQMEIEEHKNIWKSEEEESMVSATVGRVMTTLLTAKPTKLADSISRLQSSPNPTNLLALSLDNSLRILHKYVRDGAEKEESLDAILIPMIEHSLRSKESKYKDQEMILLNWLFQDEVLFQALARTFSGIVLRKEDHHIALGWCILARRLIDYDVTMVRFSTTGLKERYTGLLANLCICNNHLLSLISGGSTLQGGFELPTRLSMAAADCVIALSMALTRKEMITDVSENMKKSSKPISVAAVGGQKKVKAISPDSDFMRDMKMNLLLWNLLDHLIMLVQRLLAWSRKSRSLHAKGLERVQKWLQEIKKEYHSSQDQAGLQMVKPGMLLLSSCWKHYSILLHLEDHRISNRHKELLEQYLSGIEYYAGNYTTDHIDNKDSGIATINFFLNCLLLLLGRFTSKQFDTAMAEHRLHITRVVASQLCSADDDVIDGTVSILKASIFGTNHLASGRTLTDSKQMNSVLPLLLNLLDERDCPARAVVKLISEYCSMSADRYCLEEILKRLASENIAQRRNALDVLSEIIHISSDSTSILTHSVWQEIANHLLDCLKDEEDIIQAHATKLLTVIDPSLVVPALVRLIYSPDATLYSSSTSTLLQVLTYHNQKPEVVSLMLDCLSNLNASSDTQKPASYKLEGLKGDVDKVLMLIPEWSKSVKNWKLLVGPLVDKMFNEPTNSIVVKFLSYTSDQLAEAADEVFKQILLHTESQKEIDETFLSQLDISYAEKNVKLQHSLFDRLCSLLIIRLLPLRVFNDLKSSVVYGDLVQNNCRYDISETRCIAALLLKRAFNKLEFEDVRKLSAELCGRLHPNVLFPAVSSELEIAINDHDLLKIKACLFSVCTSLVVRGMECLGHPDMSRIREAIETVLLWPSTDGDEISKAQHGCIDCLAITVCAELQDSELSRSSTIKEKSIIRNGNDDTFAFHAYVLDRLTSDEHKFISSNGVVHNHMSTKQFLSFRLCMANVLISACQKISDSGKRPFTLKTIQQITRSFSNVKEPEIRAACIQVLFSMMYHLKSVVLPYSSDLLKVSLESIKLGSEMERMGGAKLLASLMASEEVIVQSISEGLLEARTLLSRTSQTDSSPGVRKLCTQVLACMISP